MPIRIPKPASLDDVPEDMRPAQLAETFTEPELPKLSVRIAKREKAKRSARHPRPTTPWEQRLVQFAIDREGVADVAGFSETSEHSVLRAAKADTNMNVGTIGAIVRHAYQLAVETEVSPSTILPSTEARQPTSAEATVVERAVAKADGGYSGVAAYALISHETVRRVARRERLYESSIFATVTAAEIVLGIDPGTGVQGRAATAKPPTRGKVEPASETAGLPESHRPKPKGPKLDAAKVGQLRAFCMGLGLSPAQIHAVEQALGVSP